MASRTLAVGDIHGCLKQLDGLLAVISRTRDDHVILLGDLVDRGPDSAGVLKRVRQVSKTHRITCLMGNHEQMMLAGVDSREKHSDWLLNGGDMTLKSYGGVRAFRRVRLGGRWNHATFRQSATMRTTHPVPVRKGGPYGFFMARASRRC